MESPWDVVDVWVGSFRDAAAFAEYCEELERDDPDDPISQFADDMGQVFIDHDLFLGLFHDPPGEDLAVRLGKHTVGAAASVAAEAEYRRQGLGLFNATITVFGEDVKNPRSVVRRHYRLDYVGQFRCRAADTLG
jgi:hypothetical protein